MLMDYWYWYHRYWDRTYGQTLPGYLLWFAMTPLVLTTKTIIFPFEAISQKYSSLKQQKDEHQELMENQSSWKDDQQALNSVQLFQKKLQEVRQSQRVLILIREKIELSSNPNNTKKEEEKGCLIVAPTDSSLQNFFPHLKKFVGINQTQSITIYHLTQSKRTMISLTKMFGFIPTNEKGFISLEIVRLQTMG